MKIGVLTHNYPRFAGDFEAAVLHAVNGGGQNLARAMLTGALVGAQVVLYAIAAPLIAVPGGLCGFAEAHTLPAPL